MIKLTWLDSNSWSIELAKKHILLDPWLVGNLSFGNLSWLFEGTKTIDRPIPQNIDLILLSQGLPDHAHVPTLEVLDRSIPVVASPSAAKIVKDLGYLHVTALAPGESFSCGDINIKAVPGSPVGPGAIENGYIIRDLSMSLYYEPHGYHHPSLAQEGKIDGIITPLIDLKLPLLGAVIKGTASALAVCELLKPKFIIPTAAGGDVKYEGIILSILTAEGSVAEFQALLKSKSLATEAIDPQPWKSFTIDCDNVELSAIGS
jgi:L-ascorbate metabolism protein UlaG (beta-lactamase superfamily)